MGADREVTATFVDSTHGNIAGTVTGAASEEPVQGVYACAHKEGGSYGCAWTGEDGHYAITGLPAGEYEVQFNPPYESGYAPQLYDGKDSIQEADPVSVSLGETASGIDAALEAGATVAGTVTGALGGEPVQGVEVCAEEEGEGERFYYDYYYYGYYYGYYNHICAHTGEDGHYAITGLPAGDYTVRFSPPSGEYGYLTQYYDGKESLEEADPVSVSLGETASGIDAELGVSGGHIAGTVTDAASEEPVQGVYACAHKEGGSYGCAWTGEDGHYAITGLPAGEYEVQFNPPYESGYAPQLYDGKDSIQEADPVSVSLGETASGIDAALEAGATVAGTVTGALGGEPVQGVEVCAEEEGEGERFYYDYYYYGYYYGYYNHICAHTGEDGHYAITGLPAGDYTVRFSPPSGEYGYLTQYYDGKESLEEADPVSVSLGETASGIDAELGVSGGHIAGTVTDAASEEPVQGVYACAHKEGGSYGCAWTGEDGHYAITGLPAGEYEVQFNPPYESGYAPQLYDGKDSIQEADPVSVSLGETASGIDAALEAGATVAGTVTGALGGEPVQGVEVCAEEEGEGERFYYDYYYYGYYYGYYNHICAHTGEDGHYAITGLPAGDYTVRFSPPSGEYGYLTQYYDGKESLEEADPVSVSLGETASGIDAELGVSGGHIAGTVTDAASHEPIGGVEACTYIEHASYYGYCAWTGEDGHYAITGLPAGEYEVQFNPPYESGYAPQLYNGKDNLEEADAISVNLGETTSGIDGALVELPPPPANTSPPSISGEARQGETLSEHHGSWENEPESYEYQWLRCDGEGNECEPISGATGQEYALIGADVGHAISAQETAVNAGGSGGPATSAATEAVLPSPPLNTSPPTISGEARQGETLSEHHGSWENEPASYEYQWLRCDKSGASCEPISGKLRTNTP